MKILTKAYGEYEIDERQLIDVPVGLFGFENLHRYALIDAHQKPFIWLQSLEKTEVAFVLINPLLFRPDYTVDATEDDLAALEIGDPDDMLCFAIVTIPDDGRGMTANLQGPLLINRKTHRARQIISVNPQWQIRHSITDELERQRSNAC